VRDPAEVGIDAIDTLSVCATMVTSRKAVQMLPRMFGGWAQRCR
jgi:hypothetical protein